MSLFVCLPWQHAERDPGWTARALGLLNPPSWMDWQANHLDDATYVPMVYACKHSAWFSRMVARAQTGPRRMYLLGNEPCRPEQSDTSPSDFANAARTWLALVGGQWAGPGILWGGDGRDWIDGYLRGGGPTPDVWTIHIYGSRDVDGWRTQYLHALDWFGRRGASNPVWITETNGDEQLMHYLASEPGITAYWYSAHDYNAGMHSADLVNADATALTDLGRLYASLQGPGGAGAPMQAQGWLPVVRDA